MKNYFLFLFFAGALIYSCQPANDNTEAGTKTTAPAMTHMDSVKRGAYLVTMMGCNDCHSPKVFTPDGRMLFDSTRLLSGHPKDEVLPQITDKAMMAPGQWMLFSPGGTAFVGPWGTSFAANLTPHATGTEAWTFEHFKTVLTKGKYKGLENSRPIMPPMPWENFAHMEAGDMQLIWTYLRSLTPVDNLVPAYQPPTQG